MNCLIFYITNSSHFNYNNIFEPLTFNLNTISFNIYQFYHQVFLSVILSKKGISLPIETVHEVNTDWSASEKLAIFDINSSICCRLFLEINDGFAFARAFVVTEDLDFLNLSTINKVVI